jgi:hypothetical protein
MVKLEDPSLLRQVYFSGGSEPKASRAATQAAESALAIRRGRPANERAGLVRR